MSNYIDLIDDLNSSDWIRREAAAAALGRVGEVAAVAPLLQALFDDNVWVRANAAESLGELGGAAALEPLITLLDDPDEWVRANAAAALGKLGSAEALAPLLRVVNSGDNLWVRGSAVKALGYLGPLARSALDDMLSLLEDPVVSEVRIEIIQVIKALWKTGDHRIVPPLISKLKNPITGLSEILPEIAAVLASIPDIRVLAPLTAYYKEKSSSGSEASQAVKELTRRIAAFQQELMKDFSALFCLECCCRPQRQKIRLGLFKSQAVAVCPRCGTSMLTPGIKEVVGVIDNQTGQELEDGILTVHIWDQQNPNCTYADLDRLEIRDAAGVNYDFAANAMWLTFHDSGIRDPAYWKKYVPVQIINNPPISPGMVSMIRENFLSVIEETR